MKTLYLLGAIYVALFLQACTTTDTVKPTQHQKSAHEQETQPPQCHKHRDPEQVSLLTNPANAHLPYLVVGKATVSKFNLAGVKRQDATIHDIMRELAASLDGDALIDVKRSADSVTATVIAYKRVMV